MASGDMVQFHLIGSLGHDPDQGFGAAGPYQHLAVFSQFFCIPADHIGDGGVLLPAVLVLHPYVQQGLGYFTIRAPSWLRVWLCRTRLLNRFTAVIMPSPVRTRSPKMMCRSVRRPACNHASAFLPAHGDLPTLVFTVRPPCSFMAFARPTLLMTVVTSTLSFSLLKPSSDPGRRSA